MTAPPSLDQVAPLGQRLERVEPRAARLHRLAFDARMQDWLRHALGRPELRILRGGMRDTGMLLDVDAGEGRLQVGVETADWPALRMALDLPDSDSACAVASVLLAPVLQALAGRLGPAKVAGRSPGPAASAKGPALVTVATSIVRVAIHDVDAAAAGRLGRLLADARPRVPASFRSLCVAGRLRLLARSFSHSALGALRSGDVVLFDAGTASPPRFRTYFGKGTTMQFDSQLEVESGRLQAASSPVLRDEQPEDPELGDASISELQLPVTFEVDTARITLGELASIQPGYVVELDSPIDSATVRLVCHGQTVGLGQLVAVGKHMGVRIIRMGLRHDAIAND